MKIFMSYVIIFYQLSKYILFKSIQSADKSVQLSVKSTELMKQYIKELAMHNTVNDNRTRIWHFGLLLMNTATSQFMIMSLIK